MRRIIAVAVNQIRIEFSNVSTFIFYLLLPLVFTAVVGIGLGGSSEEGDPRLVYALINLDSGSASDALVNAMENAQSSRPILTTFEQAMTAMDEDQINVTVVIPEELSSHVMNGERAELRYILRENNTRSMAIREDIRSSAARTSARYVVMQISMEEAERIYAFETENQRSAYQSQSLRLAEQFSESPPVGVRIESGADNSTVIADGFEQSSPGQLVTWTLITLLGGSVAIVNERKFGTLRRLLTMPASKFEIIAGMILGWLIMGVVQMVLLIVFGALVFDIPWGRSPAALSMVLFSFALAATSLGLLFATLARSSKQANGWTVMFSMLMAALGGAWWPLEITPPAYQMAVSFVPSTWAMRGFTDVIIRGQGVEGVLLESLVMTGFAVIFFGLGIWRFKFE